MAESEDNATERSALFVEAEKLSDLAEAGVIESTVGSGAGTELVDLDKETGAAVCIRCGVVQAKVAHENYRDCFDELWRALCKLGVEVQGGP